ncbi:SDR family oxidoreductase [Nonomuraea sp. K274]|uniref:SDR family oxidoreductase n=1 Tax=Nonomuraea cypriaca TaxID=1187855 RepID=A0A931EY35_9ACTN|nr:glucose 1-dehydrogenase [Nonomuraea cypriaca]MBF8186905.1 SDR family oxidoreductase [Nonomuraea cypriaca]
MNRLAGRNAVVTGAASGIGWEIARLFHAEGADVTLIDFNAESVRKRAAELGERALAQPADVTDEDQLAAGIEAAVAAFGPVHIGVNSAGVGALAPIAELAASEWRRIVEVCLTGVFLSIKHEARHMSEGGSIVNIASLNARQPAEGFAAYCAAKAGVEMLTKVAAMELGARGVRVNALAPGLVDTPLSKAFTGSPLRREFVANIPLGRIGEPADVAAAALFLASAESSWVTGDTLVVDGGQHTKRYPELIKHFRRGERGRRR